MALKDITPSESSHHLFLKPANDGVPFKNPRFPIETKGRQWYNPCEHKRYMTQEIAGISIEPLNACLNRAIEGAKLTNSTGLRSVDINPSGFDSVEFAKIEELGAIGVVFKRHSAIPPKVESVLPMILPYKQESVGIAKVITRQCGIMLQSSDIVDMQTRLCRLRFAQSPMTKGIRRFCGLVQHSLETPLMLDPQFREGIPQTLQDKPVPMWQKLYPQEDIMRRKLEGHEEEKSIEALCGIQIARNYDYHRQRHTLPPAASLERDRAEENTAHTLWQQRSTVTGAPSASARPR